MRSTHPAQQQSHDRGLAHALSGGQGAQHGCEAELKLIFTTNEIDCRRSLC
jgi:hypothetical protein